MNILITDFFGGKAGATMSISYLANGLASRGHNIYVLCKPDSLLAEKLDKRMVEVICWDVSGHLDFNAAKRLARLVEEKEIQLINAQSTRDRHIVAWARLFYKMGALVVHTRRQDARSTSWIKRQFYVNTTDKIVAISHGLKDLLVKDGYPERHLHVIHNGIPLDRYEQWSDAKVAEFRIRYGIKKDDIVIGCVSRKKEQWQIIKALAALNRPEIKLVFAGVKAGCFDDEIKKYNLLNPVSYLGFIDNAEVLNLYKLFSINILATRMDGFGLAIVEAMAMACPVIGTDFGGVKDIINDGVNGFRYDYDDVDDLKKKIRFLLDNKRLRESFIDNGLYTARECFSMEKTLDSYEQFFYQMVKSNRSLATA